MTGKKPGSNPEDNSDVEDAMVVLDEDIIDRNVPMDRGYAWVILAGTYNFFL